MPNKMLIDASHPEETRVVVVRGNRIEEFDFESQDKKQLKGNIYLARVTRVEPSLQAAFVEYGGNRHGFLAFSEIHPDYYQIPVADRQALLRAEQEAAEEEDEENGEGEERQGRARRGRRRGRHRGRNGDEAKAAGEESAAAEDGDNGSNGDEADANGNGEASEEAALDAETNTTMAANADAHVISEEVTSAQEDRGTVEEVHHDNNGDDQEVESVGAEDALEEVRDRRKPLRRQYKIQEVIKRRQILLVQVVKEERGNKGAALTTYLSLAGRYSVLMPNTARGGGISRKITNAQDRKRLKEVVADLDVPQGMGVILRTAGESRTKAEIKRDYEYLMRLWENVRNLTLQSTAPALVYEEGSLIKRSVRDLYNKDIDEILVAGEEGYREAKDFMRMLMPSHAKVVQPYRDTIPIFARNGIEAQLDKMLQPQVTLKSGGYLIINQTEALVSIDVNSGRSTKEHNIEDTALQTNLEAAEEVARQLRLRDLAGLIVIDFIDMEENRNNRAVEKRLKEHLKNDRARIQVGRISHFGLLEMSRQRIRASVLESTTKPCPHCGGTGHVRSDSSVALMVVRAIEEFLLKDSRSHITVKTPAATALYILNHKRSTLVDLERRFGLTITVEADDTVGAQHYSIVRGPLAEKPEGFVEAKAQPIPVEQEEDDIIVEADEETEEDEPRQAGQPQQNGGQNGEGQRKRRRRRRRRGGRDREQGAADQGEAVASSESEGAPRPDDDEDEAESAEETADAEHGAIAADTAPAKKRRRGKRGGKRNRNDDQTVTAEGGESYDGAEAADAVSAVARDEEPVVAEPPAADAVPEVVAAEEAAAAEATEAKPKKPRRSRAKKAEEAQATPAEAPVAEVAVAANEAPAADDASAAEAEPAADAPKPRASRRKPAAPAAAEAPVVVSSTLTERGAEPAEEKPKRVGWWQRKGFF
jgi:ribonuclease E